MANEKALYLGGHYYLNNAAGIANCQNCKQLLKLVNQAFC